LFTERDTPAHTERLATKGRRNVEVRESPFDCGVEAEGDDRLVRAVVDVGPRVGYLLAAYNRDIAQEQRLVVLDIRWVDFETCGNSRLTDGFESLRPRSFALGAVSRPGYTQTDTACASTRLFKSGPLPTRDRRHYPWRRSRPLYEEQRRANAPFATDFDHRMGLLGCPAISVA
jgi:hypothetical protein